jgi:hypothetical protein
VPVAFSARESCHAIVRCCIVHDNVLDPNGVQFESMLGLAELMLDFGLFWPRDTAAAAKDAANDIHAATTSRVRSRSGSYATRVQIRAS